MASQHGEGHNEHVKTTPGAKHEDSKIFPEGKTRDFSSASSVSSSSSSPRSSSSSSLLEYDNAEKGPFDGDLSNFTTHTPQWSMLSASPPPEVLLQSPSVQRMGQYDPNRIPSSIFSPKATNPSEWSVASNESLFSIHMGNNSFSRDNAIQLGKSGELPRLDECNPSSLPPVMEVSAHEESGVTSVKVSGLEKEDSDNSLTVAPGANIETHATEKTAPVANMENHAMEKTVPAGVVRLASSSTPRLSDESGNSSSSFAFPVLVNDSGKTGSLVGVTEKTETPQLQEQVPKNETPKASRTRRCSWTCWPRCC